MSCERPLEFLTSPCHMNGIKTRASQHSNALGQRNNRTSCITMMSIRSRYNELSEVSL